MDTQHFDRRRTANGPGQPAQVAEPYAALIPGGCWCGGDLVLDTFHGGTPVSPRAGYLAPDVTLAQRALDGFVGVHTPCSLTVADLPVTAWRYTCRNAPVGQRPEGCGRRFLRLVNARMHLLRRHGEAPVRLW